MHFADFQFEAARHDQNPGHESKGILVALLGLAGEVGTLLSEYKKLLRDGAAHQRFEDAAAEDLGDLLWYVSTVATKFNLGLEEIAATNLRKIAARWPSPGLISSYRLFDESFPEDERFLRRLRVDFREEALAKGSRVTLASDGRTLGDALTDNALEDDGYRFHDVFHLSYAAVLGWSPILRKLMKLKRKSDPKTDEIEDGARARIVEECVSQLVFTYAQSHDFLNGIKRLDYHLLKTIHTLVAGREVESRSLAEWEDAILQGYRVWRSVRANGGGTVELDLVDRRITFVDAAAGDVA